MDKSLLMFQPGGGVRTAKKMLGDGEERAEHSLYFKPQNPSQIAAFYGAERRFPDTEAGDLARGARLRIGPLPADCAVYVWEGGVEAGGESLAAGSSVVDDLLIRYAGNSVAITSST